MGAGTMTKVENIVVLGAGAMGCLFAARMAEAGARVTLVDVDRGRLQAISGGGLELIDDHGARTLRPATSLAGDLSGPVDLVVLFTKGMHSRSAAASVAHLRAFSPLALTLQNGIGNSEILAEQFGEDRVIMGTAMVPADLEVPNKITTHGFSTVHIGGMTAAAHSEVQSVADLLTRSRFSPVVTPNIEYAVWEKLAFNAALNALAMITQSNNAALDNAPGRTIVSQSIAETVAVAKARGIDLNSKVIEQHVTSALEKHPGHEASMLQDRRFGRRTEIGSINGAIVSEGRRLGVPTPVNAVLADLVRLIETNGPVGSVRCTAALDT